MVKRILHDYDVENVMEICIYNYGFVRKHGTIENSAKVCESIAPYVNSKNKYITFFVQNPYKLYSNVYFCLKKKFTTFHSALKYALMMNTYVDFDPYTAIPAPPPRRFFIVTLAGIKWYLKNPSTHHYWNKIWHNCNGGCFFQNNFGYTKKHFLEEINAYRKILGHNPLQISYKLCVLADTRAEIMSEKNKLFSDPDKRHHEIIFYAPYGYGMYAIKILFDDTYFSHKKFNYKAAKVGNGFARLLSYDQKYVGFGLSRSINVIYGCIKYSSTPY
uniref:SCP domain-containing protein n=1 Tax=Strongyloides venezuelensis TaxID=75913 RepID=A0A0K0FIX7_STRVS